MNVTIIYTSRTKENIKGQCIPRFHFAACYIMEMQMDVYQRGISTKHMRFHILQMFWEQILFPTVTSPIT
jgi:hypothetical protein